MAEPSLPVKFPAVMDLLPGTYKWCQCGRSKQQPFCDGSHGGTEFTPVEFVLEEKKRVSLCQCKRTGGAPYCDETHKKLDRR